MEPAQGDPLGFLPPLAGFRGRGQEERGRWRWGASLGSGCPSPPDGLTVWLPQRWLWLSGPTVDVPQGAFSRGMEGGLGDRAGLLPGLGLAPAWGWQPLLGRQAAPLGFEGPRGVLWVRWALTRTPGALSGLPWGSWSSEAQGELGRAMGNREGGL